MSASNNNSAPNQKLQGAYSKGQLYGSPRLPSYRLRDPPKKRPRRSRGNSGCLCCSCLIVLLLLLVLLAGIAGLVSWVIYRPKLPKVSLTSVQVPKFNVTANSTLTGNSTLTSEFIVKLLAVNRNEKLSFVYGNSSVQLSSRGVELAAGTIPGFLNQKDNSTVVTADLKGDGVALQDSDARRLRAAGSSGEITLDIQVVTHVGVKINQWKSQKLRVEVNCRGVSAQISPANNNSSAGSADSNSKCKFKVRIKIFRWYL